MPTYRFNPAPGWPSTEENWTPPKGWQPDPSWPAAPESWNFWTEIRDPYQPPEDHVPRLESQAVVKQGPPVEQVPVRISPRKENYNSIPVLYTREQQGRSAFLYSAGTLIAFLVGVLPILLGYSNLLSIVFLGLFILFVGQAAYFTKSPNYYWKL